MPDSCCTGQAQGGGCCSSQGEVMLLACSGASNLGQLANQACLELTQEGFGKMFCLAGIGGELSGFVCSAKDVPKIVVMDGCELGCAKAIFAKAGVPLRGYLVLSSLGLAKNKDFNLQRAQIDQVKEAARQAVA